MKNSSLPMTGFQGFLKAERYTFSTSKSYLFALRKFFRTHEGDPSNVTRSDLDAHLQSLRQAEQPGFVSAWRVFRLYARTVGKELVDVQVEGRETLKVTHAALVENLPRVMILVGLTSEEVLTLRMSGVHATSKGVVFNLPGQSSRWLSLLHLDRVQAVVAWGYPRGEPRDLERAPFVPAAPGSEEPMPLQKLKAILRASGNHRQLRRSVEKERDQRPMLMARQPSMPLEEEPSPSSPPLPSTPLFEPVPPYKLAAEEGESDGKSVDFTTLEL